MSARPMKPKDGTIWVTGASSGIGKALVHRLVKKGWSVAMSARSEDALRAIEEDTGGKAKSYPLDVTDTDATREVLERIDAARPQLVLVSAGFDAHHDDPLAGLSLQADDYAWIAGQIAALARAHGTGTVSTLEGGYDLAALGESVDAYLSHLA